MEDMIDYCVMQNWYDILKESEAAKWTNHDSRIGKKSNHDPREKKNRLIMLRVKSIRDPLVNHGGR